MLHEFLYSVVDLRNTGYAYEVATLRRNFAEEVSFRICRLKIRKFPNADKLKNSINRVLRRYV